VFYPAMGKTVPSGVSVPSPLPRARRVAPAQFQAYALPVYNPVNLRRQSGEGIPKNAIVLIIERYAASGSLSVKLLLDFVRLLLESRELLDQFLDID
jgi:hypothetical protein